MHVLSLVTDRMCRNQNLLIDSLLTPCEECFGFWRAFENSAVGSKCLYYAPHNLRENGVATFGAFPWDLSSPKLCLFFSCVHFRRSLKSSVEAHSQIATAPSPQSLHCSTTMGRSPHAWGITGVESEHQIHAKNHQKRWQTELYNSYEDTGSSYSYPLSTP